MNKKTMELLEADFLLLLPSAFITTGKLAVTTLVYPFINAKTLIQLGHEPLALYSTKTLLGAPVSRFPNVFNYVKYIYGVGGVKGCYRGFLPWFSKSVIYNFTFLHTKRCFPVIPFENINENYLTNYERAALFIETTMREIICRSLGIIVTQPLYVLTVRTIAQFIGKEDKYVGVFSGIWTILKEEGVLGLFSGLIPRLMGEIFQLTSAAIVIHLVHQYIKNDCVDYIIQQETRNSFHSFTIVSSCMAVSNCGLAAGSPPHMPHYPDMFKCWSHLQSVNHLKRGSISSILWRNNAPVKI